MKVNDSLWGTSPLALKVYVWNLSWCYYFDVCSKTSDVICFTLPFFSFLCIMRKTNKLLKMLFLIAMSVKAPSIVHCLASIAVLAGRFLNMTIIEALQITWNFSCRFFSKLYKRAAGALLMQCTNQVNKMILMRMRTRLCLILFVQSIHLLVFWCSSTLSSSSISI